MHYLYKITNKINDKVYIGQTIHPRRRWKEHQRLAEKNAIQHIHRAMAKYGMENFEFEIIAACDTLKDADCTEILLIKQYNSRDKQYGYNIANGGENGMLGFIHSEESKRKMSDSKRGWKPSIETRQRMKESRSKVIITPEWAHNISKSNKGKKLSQDTKRKISEAQKLINRNYLELSIRAAKINRGKKRSQETIQKMKKNHKGFFGMKHSDEAKKKISKTSKDRIKKPMSDETKRKISESKIGKSNLALKGKSNWKKGKILQVINGKKVWIKQEVSL